MTLFFADLVREASWGSGTADLPLGGALAGHRSFAEAVPPGARFHYCIAGVTRPDEWETGEGEIGSGGTLVRLPLASSSGGSAVDFSAGLKTVALTVAADWFAAREAGVAAIGDIVGLQAALDGKADAAHGHGLAEVEGLGAALAGKAAAAHGHAIGDVSGLETALDGKAALAHGHAISEVAGLQPALDAKLAAAEVSAFARSLIDDGDAAAARSTLELGSAATRDTGTSGSAVPLLDGANSWSNTQIIELGQNAATLMSIRNGDGGTAASAQIELRNGALGNNDRVLIGCYGTGYTGVSSFQDAGVISARANLAGGLILGVASASQTLKFQVGDNATKLTLAGDGIDLASGCTVKVAGMQVVAARRTGWGTPTGTSTRTAFDTATVTTAQLAERLKALIDDLRSHGLIGT